MLFQHIKGQPAASTYVREKGGVTCDLNRETPCSFGGNKSLPEMMLLLTASVGPDRRPTYIVYIVHYIVFFGICRLSVSFLAKNQQCVGCRRVSCRSATDNQQRPTTNTILSNIISACDVTNHLPKSDGHLIIILIWTWASESAAPCHSGTSRNQPVSEKTSL